MSAAQGASWYVDQATATKVIVYLTAWTRSIVAAGWVDSLAVLACDQLNQGANKYDVVAWLSQYNPYVGNDTFLRKAALYYCPEHNNKLAGL